MTVAAGFDRAAADAMIADPPRPESGRTSAGDLEDDANACIDLVVAMLRSALLDHDRWRARAQVAELEVTAMRPVVEAAERVVDRVSIRPPREQLLPSMIDYRDGADERDAAIAKIAGDAPVEGAG